jgi:D-alanine-D-alanine ligase
MKLRSIACVIDDDIIAAVRRSDRSDRRALYDISVVRTLRRLADTVHLVAAVGASIQTLNVLARLRPDVVFNLAFSACPLEPSFVGALEVLGIPYTGSDPLGIALASDKAKSRHLLRAAGVKVPRFIELAQNCRPRGIDFEPPFIVKPTPGANSDGIYGGSVVNSFPQALKEAERIWRRLKVSAVCDEFIIGREFQVGMVEARRGAFHVTAIVELHFSSAQPGWAFKSEAVMRKGKRCRLYDISVRPALLPRPLKIKMAKTAVTAVKVLGLHGYAKVDLRMDDQENIVVIEVNPNPGILSTSKIWRTPGFERNLKRIINSALRRAQEC